MFDWKAAKVIADYKKLSLTDILEYCKEHDKLDWLKKADAELNAQDRKRAYPLSSLRTKFIDEVLGLKKKPSSRKQSVSAMIADFLSDK